MTVPVQSPVSNHIGNGVTTSYPYGYKLLDAADLIVIVDEITGVLGIDYTVAGVGVESGGSVTFTVAPASGAAVALVRQVTINRLIDYQYQGDFQSPTVNRDLDRLVMMAQDSALALTKALRLPPGDPAGVVLPAVAQRSLRTLAFDADGNLLLRASVDPVGPILTNEGLGQCRLNKVGSNIALQPYNGNKLTIDRVAYAIPPEGVTLPPNGIASGALQFIYAFTNAGEIKLEHSGTSAVQDGATGVSIKAGDASRTLVGMVLPLDGSFRDSPTQRLVISWFNPLPAAMSSASVADFSKNDGTFAALPNFPALQFLSFGDRSASVGTNMPIRHSAAGGIVYTGLGLDATTPNLPAVHQWQAFGVNAIGSAVWSGEAEPAIGYHFLLACGSTSGATATWLAGGTLHATVWK